MDAVFQIEKGLHVKGANSIFEQRVYINDILTVNSDAVFVTGNLTVTGNLNYSNTSVAGDMVPTTNGLNLGNGTNRFSVWATDVNVSGQVVPSTTNGNLGSISLRWFVYSSNTDVQNVLTANNLMVASNLVFANSTTRKVGINTIPSGTATLQVGGDASITGNVSATAISAPTISASGNVVSLHGAQLVTNNATVAVTATPQLVDSFPKSISKFAKYLARVANTTNGIHGADIILVHEGTNVIMTVEEVFASELGVFDANINGANVELTYTGTAGETVNLLRMQVLE